MREEEKLEIIQATEADTEEILRLYKAQLGQEFCAWDEHYPERKDIAYDLSRDALFVMKNEAGEIVAAISIDEDENVRSFHAGLQNCSREVKWHVSRCEKTIRIRELPGR